MRYLKALILMGCFSLLSLPTSYAKNTVCYAYGSNYPTDGDCYQLQVTCGNTSAAAYIFMTQSYNAEKVANLYCGVIFKTRTSKLEGLSPASAESCVYASYQKTIIGFTANPNLRVVTLLHDCKKL